MYDLVVVGGGPAGYLSAVRARSYGLRVALVEGRYLGGECTNWGCIPTKTLIEVAEENYKLRLLRQAGLSVELKGIEWGQLMDYVSRAVTRSREGVKVLLSEVEVLEGWARLAGVGSVKVESAGSTARLESRYIIVATGSEPRSLPGVPVDGEVVITNREFFQLRKPPESIAIVGAGAIGVEIATAMAMLGKEVHVIEILERSLYFTDPDVSAVVERSLRRLGVKLMFRSSAKRVVVREGVAQLEVSSGDGVTKTVEVEKVLVAIGRKPNVEGIGLEVAGVDYDTKSGIKVDSNMVTSVPTILAAGDVTGPPQLAHKAFREAIIASDYVAGIRNSLPREPIPQVVFSHPQVAQVGLTEQEATARGITYKVFKFPYIALGRNTTALAKSSEGFAKLLVDEGGKVLGAQIVGNEASELIHIFSLALSKGMTVKDLAEAIYTHPTYSEVVGEVASLALGKPLHIK